MRKTNRQIFEELSIEEYYKESEQAAKRIKRLALFPDVIGFDEETNGLVALHKKHSPSAIEDEFLACIFLKENGFGVILLDETVGIFNPDAIIEARFFEIKRLSKAKNLIGAVNDHFRKTYKKAPNLVLHIDQLVNANSLRTAIMLATEKHSEVRSVWVIYTEKLWRLDRKIIVKGQFQLR